MGYRNQLTKNRALLIFHYMSNAHVWSAGRSDSRRSLPMARLGLSALFVVASALPSLACSSTDGTGSTPAPVGTGTGGPPSGGPLAIGQQVPYPTRDWTTVPPSQMKMDAALLDQACDYALRFDG